MSNSRDGEGDTSGSSVNITGNVYSNSSDEEVKKLLKQDPTFSVSISQLNSKYLLAKHLLTELSSLDKDCRVKVYNELLKVFKQRNITPEIKNEFINVINQEQFRLFIWKNNEYKKLSEEWQAAFKLYQRDKNQSHLGASWIKYSTFLSKYFTDEAPILNASAQKRLLKAAYQDQIEFKEHFPENSSGQDLLSKLSSEKKEVRKAAYNRIVDTMGKKLSIEQDDFLKIISENSKIIFSQQQGEQFALLHQKWINGLKKVNKAKSSLRLEQLSDLNDKWVELSDFLKNQLPMKIFPASTNKIFLEFVFTKDQLQAEASNDSVYQGTTVELNVLNSDTSETQIVHKSTEESLFEDRKLLYSELGKYPTIQKKPINTNDETIKYTINPFPHDKEKPNQYDKTLYDGIKIYSDKRSAKIKNYKENSKLFQNKELDATDPQYFRKLYLEFVTDPKEMAKRPRCTPQIRENNKENPEAQQIDMQLLLGKEGVELYKLALEEERYDKNFMGYAAAKCSEIVIGEEWSERPVIVVSGPSASGKTYVSTCEDGAIDRVYKTLEKDSNSATLGKYVGKENEQIKGRLAVFQDGGPVRECSQIRNLTVHLTNHCGWAVCTDLEKQSSALKKVKTCIREATLANPKHGLLIIDTFSGFGAEYFFNPLKRLFGKKSKTIKLFKRIIKSPNTKLVFTQVEINQDSAKIQGNSRATEKTWDEKTGKLSLNTPPRSESKIYGASGYLPGKIGSTLVGKALQKIVGDSLLSMKIINDRMPMKKINQDNEEEQWEISNSPDAKLVSSRVYDAWLAKNEEIKQHNYNNPNDLRTKQALDDFVKNYKIKPWIEQSASLKLKYANQILLKSQIELDAKIKKIKNTNKGTPNIHAINNLDKFEAIKKELDIIIQDLSKTNQLNKQKVNELISEVNTVMVTMNRHALSKVPLKQKNRNIIPGYKTLRNLSKVLVDLEKTFKTPDLSYPENLDVGINHSEPVTNSPSPKSSESKKKLTMFGPILHMTNKITSSIVNSIKPAVNEKKSHDIELKDIELKDVKLNKSKRYVRELLPVVLEQNATEAQIKVELDKHLKSANLNNDEPTRLISESTEKLSGNRILVKRFYVPQELRVNNLLSHKEDAAVVTVHKIENHSSITQLFSDKSLNNSSPEHLADLMNSALIMHFAKEIQSRSASQDLETQVNNLNLKLFLHVGEKSGFSRRALKALKIIADMSDIKIHETSRKPVLDNLNVKDGFERKVKKSIQNQYPADKGESTPSISSEFKKAIISKVKELNEEAETEKHRLHDNHH